MCCTYCYKMAGSSSSSSSNAAAASTWEEAEGEFYQEAFLPGVGGGGRSGDQSSRTSTLDTSNYSAYYDSGSMETVIHRPADVVVATTTSSKILAAAVRARLQYNTAYR